MSNVIIIKWIALLDKMDSYLVAGAHGKGRYNGVPFRAYRLPFKAVVRNPRLLDNALNEIVIFHKKHIKIHIGPAYRAG
jgi:hypothetical protein